MQKLIVTCSSDRNKSSLNFWHGLLFSVCSISLTKYWLYAPVMHSIYTKYQNVYSLSKRERAAAHARNCVYLITIENSSYIMNLYHIQCQCVDVLNRLVWIKLQHPFPDSYLSSKLRVDPSFFPLVFESAAIFSIITNHAYCEFSKTTISLLKSSP